MPMEYNKYGHISTLLLKALFSNLSEELQGSSTSYSTPGMRYTGDLHEIDGYFDRSLEDNRRLVSLELAASRRAYILAEQQHRRMPQIYAAKIDEPLGNKPSRP